MINEFNLQNGSNNQFNSIQPPSKKILEFYLLGVFTMLIISGLTVFSFLKYRQKPAIVVDNNQSFVETPTTTSSTDKFSSNWALFKQDVKETPSSPKEFTFEFKYPSDWQFKERPDTLDIYWSIPKAPEPSMVMQLSVSDSQGKSVDDWIKRDQIPYNLIKRLGKNFDGLIVSDPATEGNDTTIAFFKVNDKIISLMVNSNPPQINENPVQLLEIILSTFKISY